MLQHTFLTSLTDVWSTQYDRLGAIRVENDKTYKYVKFTGTTTIAVGDVVCYVASDTTCQTVDGANTAVGAGVALAAVASGTVQYGWIQVSGVATLSTALAGTPAVGDELTTNGAAAPAVTKKTTNANAESFAVTVHVANKIVLINTAY